MLESVGLCFQPEAGLTFPLHPHLSTAVPGLSVGGKASVCSQGCGEGSIESCGFWKVGGRLQQEALGGK